MVVIDCKSNTVTIDGKDYSFPPILVKVICHLYKKNNTANYKNLYIAIAGKKTSPLIRNKGGKNTKSAEDSWYDTSVKKKYNDFRKNNPAFPNCLKFYGRQKDKRIKLDTDEILINSENTHSYTATASTTSVDEIRMWIDECLNISDDNSYKNGNFLSAIDYINFLITACREEKIALSRPERLCLMYEKVFAKIGLEKILTLFLELTEKEGEESTSEIERLHSKYRRIFNKIYDYSGNMGTLKSALKHYLGEIDFDIENDIDEIDDVLAYVIEVKNKRNQITELKEDFAVKLEELNRHPFWGEAAEKIMQLSAPSMCAGGYATATGFTLTNACLPREVKGIQFYVDEDGTIAGKCDFKGTDKKFQIKFYICPSAIGEEIVEWTGNRPELEYTYEYSEKVKKGQPDLILELGKVKGLREFDLKKLFDFRRTKIITIPGR